MSSPGSAWSRFGAWFAAQDKGIQVAVVSAVGVVLAALIGGAATIASALISASGAHPVAAPETPATASPAAQTDSRTDSRTKHPTPGSTATPTPSTPKPSTPKPSTPTSPSDSPTTEPTQPMRVSYSGTYTVRGIGDEYCAGGAPSTAYVNFDSLRQRISSSQDSFEQETSSPADIALDCRAPDAPTKDAIEGATATVGRGPATRPRDPAGCARAAVTQGVSKLFLKDLVPHRSALCIAATSGSVIWLRYESGAVFTGDGMRPDLTFTVTVWKP